MYHHIKKLMYTVHVNQPDPRFGNMLLEQFGGANGEALRMVSKNPLSIGSIPPSPGIVDQWYNDSTGEGDNGEIDADGPWKTQISATARGRCCER
jgi:hypothetical protein